jgi:hypothetical protein
MGRRESRGAPAGSIADVAGAASLLESSATIASVVIKRPATEAASWSAMRTTLVGLMMPASAS